MNGGSIDISYWQMALAFVYAVVVIGMVRRMGIPREQQILIACVRMTIQLVIAGYILTWLFDNPSFLWIAIVLIAMVSFAIYNAIKRLSSPVTQPMKRIIAIALAVGTLGSLGYFLLVVVGGDAWENPRYAIPLAGMIIGNAMTGVTLAMNRLLDGVHDQRPMIESALMLGARPRDAVADIIRRAFDAAVLPTINSMVGLGIVFLPGMMTGQILAGESPFTAIKYQIAIMLGIMGSVAFSVLILVEWGSRSFFNADAQLIDPAQPDDADQQEA